MKKHPARTYHRMIEAFNFVAARETYLTDPAFDDKGGEVSNEHFLRMAQSRKFACLVMSASDEEIWVQALTELITYGLLAECQDALLISDVLRSF